MRYVVVGGSQTAHGCCFVATVVDTTKPSKFYGGDKYEVVCECLEDEDAEKIADALNKAEEK